MNTELKELALKVMDSDMTDDTKVELLFYMFSRIDLYNLCTSTNDGYSIRYDCRGETNE